MSTPPPPPGAQPAGPPSDDRTRDLRRPSLPNQPPAEALPSQPDTIAGQPTDRLPSPPRERERTLTFGAPAADRPGPASGSPVADVAAPAPGAPGAAPLQPSPGIGAPSYGLPSSGTGVAPTGGRRWPWVVLVLLSILVIAGTGVLLFLLLGGA